MSSKAKAKALVDDFDDDEVMSMLGIETPTPGDPDQWARDNNGDLDWGYTARTMRNWSQDALLSHLWEKSFSIPPREYNPSAPFVWVRLASGDVVTLPHGYRLPLMFVAKYRWEITLSKISNERQWKQERSNMFHLSRLCENLFRRAQVKASRGGMEKGWRCVMFDRLLARFYKHWARNDPDGGKGFLTTHGAKEYDRDVLKHDWKRWCLRGLNGVKMTEDEVTNGITIEQFRKTLKKRDDCVWTIDGQPLTHITDKAPPDYSSSSELTDYSMDSDDNSSEADSESEVSHHTDAPPNDAPSSSSPRDVTSTPFISPGGRHLHPHKRFNVPVSNEALKRGREFPADDDEIERANKRNRIQNVLENKVQYHTSFDPTNPLSRTLAAMARNPVWAHTQTASAPGLVSTPRLPQDSAPPFPSPTPLTNSGDTISLPTTTASATTLQNVDSPHVPPHPYEEEEDSTSVVALQPVSLTAQPPADPVSPPPANGDPASVLPSLHPQPVSFTSTKSQSTRPSRAAAQKSRQPARASGSALPQALSISTTSQPRRHASQKSIQMGRKSAAVRYLQSTMAPPPRSTASSSTSTPAPGNPNLPSTTVIIGQPAPGAQGQAQQSSIHVTALELLEKLVDVKRVLQERFPFTSTPLEAAAAASSIAGSSTQVQLEGGTDASSPSMGQGTSNVAPVVVDLEKTKEERTAIQAKLADFEGQFAGIKEELKGIVERLQILEGSAPSSVTQAAANVLARTEGANTYIATGEETDGMDLDVAPPNAQQLPPVEPLSGDATGQTTVEGQVTEQESTTGSHGLDLSASAPAPTEEVGKEPGSPPESTTVGEPPTGANVVAGTVAEKERMDEGTWDVSVGDTSAEDARRSEPIASVSLQATEPVPAPPKETTPDGEHQYSQVPPSQPQDHAGEGEVTQSAHGDDVRSHSEDRQTTAEPSPIVPTGTTANPSPQIDPRALDRDASAHKHGSSEPDTDITMLNAIGSTSSTSTLLNETPDPRVRDMSSNLSLLVESFVSAKMLSVMESMVKNRVKDRESEKEKEKADPVNEGSIASSSADAEREREVDPPLHPLHSDSIALTQSAESHTLASLLGELRSMKEEARIREQREKEELQAMRELHSAEVDALRRRLSYLEQNRHMESVGQATMHSPSGAAAARYVSTSVSSYPPAHAESSYQGHHHTGALPYGGGVQFPGKGPAQASPVESQPPLKEPPPPVRIYTDRNFSSSRPEAERDEETPLPIKSQRKQHMVFSRAQYG